MSNSKGIALVGLFMLICGLGFGQSTSLEKLKNMNARAIGPAGMSGRITSIDVLRSNPDMILVGSASGGVWMSKSGGVAWAPLFDDEEIQNIGAVAIQQSNPSILWVGTGEGNPRNSHNSGAGIFKSIDGGRTWMHMGLKETKSIHRIIIDPSNENTVYAASLGSAWGPNKERGLFKSIDGGENWKQVLFVNDSTGCADLVMDPENPNKLIAAMWQYHRSPWFFTSGGKSSGLYISYDGGETWKRKNQDQGLPKGDLGRIGLAIAPSKPEIVYALIEAKKTGLYRSEDGGEHWSLVATENIGNRPFYYADIFVDSKNENRLYNLYSLVSQSEDGGKSFKVILPYSGVHPDHHALYIHPDNPRFMLDGNDGGLNISRDGGKTWRFVENLPLGQFYHINIDNELPYNVYGGLQDNGSWVGPAYKWQDGGLRNSDWQELLFGDGFDVLPYLPDVRFGYAMYQGGNVYRYDRLTGKNTYIQPIADSVELRFNWNAALAPNPFSPEGLYFGSQFVHQSFDQGNTWKIISPDLTTNDSTKQKQAKSGGLTIDATRAENHTTLLSIEPSSLKEGLLWVGSDDGKLHKTENGGKTWEDLSVRLKGLPTASWIPQIHASKHDEKRVFVVANNYRRNDWSTYLFRSDNGGKSFTNIALNKGIKGYALSVLEDPVEENLVFLGTEQGLWISFDAGNNWSRWEHNYPAVSTMDMKIQEREKDLVLGSFGRAIYVLDDIEILRQIAARGEGILDSNLLVFNPPMAYVHANKAAAGVRFAADAHFIGQNRNNLARISAFIKHGEAKASTSGEKDPGNKLYLKVYNTQNELIRTQKFRADTGVNRIYWDMRMDGKRLPSHAEIKDDATAPGGMHAKAGKYKVVLTYKNFKDSTILDLNYDPNWNYSEEAHEKTMRICEPVFALCDTAFSDFEKLKSMEKELNKFKANFLSDLDTSQQKAIGTNIDSLQRAIHAMKAAYMTAKDFKGYDHVTEFINSKLSRALSHCYDSEGEMNESVRIARAHAEREVLDANTHLKQFLEEKWNPFVDEISKLELRPLKKF